MNKQVKVLLVEDDYDYAYLVEKKIVKDERLSYLGHAANKTAGVDMARDLQPDIVVMDLSLSNNDLDGAEGVEAAKEIRITTDSKIIFLTAHEDSDIMKNASKKVFASGYLCKSQHNQYTDEIYNAATAMTTPHKEFIKELVLAQLTHAERSILNGLLDGRIKKNTSISFIGSSNKTIANQKSSIFNKLGLKNEKELLHIFSNW